MLRQLSIWLLAGSMALMGPSLALAAKQCKALAYDNSDPDDNIAKKGAKAADGVAVTSVADMVTKLQTLLKNREACDCLDVLVISGHGTRGWQGVGSGDSSSYMKGKDLKHDKLQDVKDELENLAKLLCRDAKVVLGGCDVAKSDKGTSLLANLSKALDKNVTVTAYTEETSATEEDGQIYKREGPQTPRGEDELKPDKARAAKEGEAIDPPEDLGECVCFKTRSGGEE